MSTSQQGSGPPNGMPHFASYLSEEQLELEPSDTVFEGLLRINQKSWEDAYISVPGGSTDVYIQGIYNRNAALHGDFVAVKLFDQQHWKIQHEKLEFLLQADDALKQLVYADKDSFETMDVFVPPGTTLRAQSLEETAPKALKEVEDEMAGLSKTQRRKLRKKAKEAERDSKEGPKEVKKKKPVVIVPPDMLSECSDVTDAESEDSLDTAVIQDATGLETGVEGELARVQILSTREEAKDVTFADIAVKKEVKEFVRNEPPVKDEVGGKLVKKESVTPAMAVKSESAKCVADRLATLNMSATTESSDNKRPLTRAENNLRNHPAFQGDSNRPAGNAGMVSKCGKATMEQVMRLSNWNRYVQRTGYVVSVKEQNHTRLAAGSLKPFPDNNLNYALFSPNDSRIPRMKIPMARCPPNLLRNRREFARRIYLSKITRWTDHKFAMGELVEDIGVQGNIEVETKAFLLQSGIDISGFKPEVLEDLPVVGDEGWSIPPEALEGRKDFRAECIFSVDPASARDLDDALSCVELPGGMYRVGVHIADVAYFVQHGSALDTVARERATSVYLVDKVIPMLPRLLCEQLCSLNPSEDRLAFSVEWELNDRGEVFSTWFGRSVIRSCGKLAYEHAQAVIEEPNKKVYDIPEPTGGHSKRKVCDTIKMLWKLASRMRNRRFMEGALKLDQMKLCFNLNADTKSPEAVHLFEGKEANWMIEEFMLLANISVAEKINEVFPDKALLRCHPKPHIGKLQETAQVLQSFGMTLDTSSAGALYHSLDTMISNKTLSQDALQVVVNMLSKPMSTALYFTPATYHEDFAHYALNVPFYTHFTSPIRRYPDVFVHRLLAAAVDSKRYSVPEVTNDRLDQIVSKANEKKVSAKQAGEHSMELYLAELVKKVGEIKTMGMIIGVLDKALDVYVSDFATIKRSYVDKMDLVEANFDPGHRDKAPQLNVVWKPDHRLQQGSISSSYTYFSEVEVVLTPFTNDQLKINCLILRPED